MAEVINNGNSKEFKSARNFGNIGGDGVVRKCPECGSKKIVTDYEHAEIYCSDCNTVIQEEIVDLGREWRAYDESQETERARTGMPETYRIHNKGLGTSLPKNMKRVRWLSIREEEKTHIFALEEIERMSSALKLPKYIIERVAYLYREAMKKKLTQGESVEGIISAILWIVCRENGIFKTRKEIAEVSRIIEKKKAKKIFKIAKKLSKELNLKIKSISPCRYVPQFCFELGLSGEIQLEAIKIIEEMSKKELISGLQPRTVASVAISIVIDLFSEHLTETKIAEVCKVSTPTLRSNRNKIEKALNIKIPAEQLSSQELVDEICSEPGFYEEIVKQKAIKDKATEIMETAEKIKEENGNKEINRKALAAASLVIAIKEKYRNNLSITKKIAKATRIDILKIRYREYQLRDQNIVEILGKK